MVPTLLVMGGDMRSLSGRGRAMKGGHDYFTGHRTHRWYPVLMVCDEYGSEAPQF